MLRTRQKKMRKITRSRQNSLSIDVNLELNTKNTHTFMLLVVVSLNHLTAEANLTHTMLGNVDGATQFPSEASLCPSTNRQGDHKWLEVIAGEAHGLCKVL